MTAVAVGIDVGGTKVAAGLVHSDGRVEHELVEPSRAPDGTDAVVEELAARLVALAGDDLCGIGAGYPEYVSPTGLLTSREVIDWRTQPLAVLNRLAPRVRCVVDSDVRCAARAEFPGPAGSAFYVSLGTGLSSALVLEGRPLAGARGEAIALGELPVADWDGNLESFVSGAGIGRRLGIDGGARAAERAAAAGDPRAIGVLQTGGEALGVALAGIVGVLDPAVVILGGGFGSVPGVLIAATRAAYERETARRPGAPPLEHARLGARAGLIGAGLAVYADAESVRAVR